MTTQTHSILESTGDSKMLPELAYRLKTSSVSVIKEMVYLAAQQMKKGNKVISLGVGIPFYNAPKHIHEYVHQELDQDATIDKYTLLTGLPKLRELFAIEATKSTLMQTSADEILVTPGSMAALFYSVLCLINPGDEVILPSPYFSSHGEQVLIAGGIPIAVPMKQDKNNGYQLDIEAIDRAITVRTKAIIVNNPNNPTGAVYDKSDLLRLARIIKKHNIYLITDEVYDYLVYDDAQYFNIASVRDLWPKVIRCCSLSKKYGVMGWRIGYLHTNKDLLMHILKIHDANIVCAPHISQIAAIAALTGPQESVKLHVQWLSENRDVILKRMDKLSDLFSYIKPKGTYYTFPAYSLPIPSIEMAKRLLYEARVVLVPGIGFGPQGEGHLRISYGSPKEDIIEAFDRIEKWWKEQQ